MSRCRSIFLIQVSTCAAVTKLQHLAVSSQTKQWAYSTYQKTIYCLRQKISTRVCKQFLMRSRFSFLEDSVIFKTVQTAVQADQCKYIVAAVMETTRQLQLQPQVPQQIQTANGLAKTSNSILQISPTFRDSSTRKKNISL